MRNFPSGTRTAYLSGSVTPLARATLRRAHPDFGPGLFMDNDDGVIGVTVYCGDDYWDPDSQQVIWGDSAANLYDDYRLRLIARAAWQAGGSTEMWRSYYGTEYPDYALSSQTGPGETLGQYTRLGVYPVSASDSFYVWYIDSADNLRRITLTPGTWTWASKTSAYNLGGIGGAAVHPISASKAIVVGYTAPYLWLRQLYYTGSWTAYTKHIIHVTDELTFADAHWSDAEMMADGIRAVVAFNLSRWGSAHATIYDTQSDIFSQPREILPSAEQWGNLRCRVSALSTANDRIWAVTTREPVGSRDVRMAHHVALASTADGTNWRDDFFVTTTALRGKLLVSGDETYCHVVGNVSVAQAASTYALGVDASTKKYLMDEVHALALSCDGTSSAPGATIRASNAGEGISGSGLLEAGNEVTVELGATDQTYGTYGKYLLVQPSRGRTFGGDEIDLECMGYASRLVGDASYRPVAAKVYDGPYTMSTNFNFDNGSARLALRASAGTWTADWVNELGRYALHCKKAGIALLPQTLACHGLVMRTAFRPEVSIEGIYFVFWYEDKNNYWQAGLYNDAGSYKVVIDRYVDGTKGSHKASLNYTGEIAAGNWYTMFLETRPGRVRVIFNDTDSYDFHATNWASYDVSQETDGMAQKYHAGLKVEDFLGWEGAILYGKAESSGTNWLDDLDANFDSTVLGKWLRCAGQDRQITGYTSTKLNIHPYWGRRPALQEEYGVYLESTLAGPGCYFKDLMVQEAITPWTVDDVINNIMALAGVSRSDAFTGTEVPVLGSSSPVMRDADIRLNTSTDGSYFTLWASTTQASGAAAYSGLRVTVYNDSGSYPSTIKLSSVESDGVSGQTITTMAWHKSAIAIPDNAAYEVRVLARKDYIVVTVDGHFATAFSHKHTVGGHCAVSYDTGTTTEFRTVMDSFIWDTDQPAAAALNRLLQGRRAKLIERSDGSVAVSRFDTPLGDAGTYSTPVVGLSTGEVGQQLVSLIEMVGAEERAFCIDETAARRGLRYMRADNPTLDTQSQALEEARRLLSLSWQRLGASKTGLYAPDPALEPEDKFTVDGVDYIVEGIDLSLEVDQDGKPATRALATCRQATSGLDTGDWGDGSSQPGDFNYDDGTVWG